MSLQLLVMFLYIFLFHIAVTLTFMIHGPVLPNIITPYFNKHLQMWFVIAQLNQHCDKQSFFVFSKSYMTFSLCINILFFLDLIPVVDAVNHDIVLSCVCLVGIIDPARALIIILLGGQWQTPCMFLSKCSQGISPFSSLVSHHKNVLSPFFNDYQLSLVSTLNICNIQIHTNVVHEILITGNSISYKACELQYSQSRQK